VEPVRHKGNAVCRHGVLLAEIKKISERPSRRGLGPPGRAVYLQYRTYVLVCQEGFPGIEKNTYLNQRTTT
jgi:hypothetical protein